MLEFVVWMFEVFWVVVEMGFCHQNDVCMWMVFSEIYIFYFC